MNTHNEQLPGYKLKFELLSRGFDEADVNYIVSGLLEKQRLEAQLPSEKTHIVGELYRVGEYEGVPTAFVSLDKDQVRALPSLPLYRLVALVQIVEGGK